MSVSGIIDSTSADPDYKDKIFPTLIPWEARPLDNQTLGQVLQTGNSASNPDTGLPQDATDFKTIGCVEIETGKVFMGNQPALQIGEAGDFLKILGATAKGSILAGNGTYTKGVPLGLNGQVLTADSTAGEGVAWGPAGGSGSVQGVSGGVNIEISGTANVNPVVNLRNPLTSGLNIGNQDITGTGGSVILNGGTAPIVQLAQITTGGTEVEFFSQSNSNTGINVESFLRTSFVGANTGATSRLEYDNNGTISLLNNSALPSTTESVISYDDGAGNKSYVSTNVSASIPQFSLVSEVGAVIQSSTSITDAEVSITNNISGDFTSIVATQVQVKNGVNNSQSVLSQGGLSLANGLGQTNTQTGTSISIQDPTIAEAVLDNNHIRIDDLAVGSYWSGTGSSLEAKKPSFAPVSANWYDIATCYNPNNLPPADTLQQVLTAGDSAIDKTMTLNATGASPSYAINVSIEPNSQNSIVSLYTDNGSGANQRVLTLASPVAGSGSTIPRPSIISSTFGSGDGLGFQIEGTESVIISPTGLGGAINTGTITETTQLTTQATTPSLAFSSTDTASTDIWNSQYRKDGWSSSFSNSISASSATATNSGGGGEMFISSSNLSIPSAHYVRVEVPAVGNAQIEHNSVGVSKKDFDISSMGQLTLIGAETSATPCQMSCASNGIFLTATQTGQKIQLDATGAGSGIICNTGNAGAGANPLAINNGYLGNTTLPMLTINNTLNSSISYPAVKLNRSGPNGAVGDIISSISSFGKDSAGASFEFSKLQTKLENVGAGNQDGTLSVFNLVNGVLLETFNFNGGQNENNSFRPIDLNGNEIRSTATNFTINATASTGNGQVDILTKNTTGRFSISGDQITSASAGGNSGRHLRIFLPNALGVLTPYKIQLLND